MSDKNNKKCFHCKSEKFRGDSYWRECKVCDSYESVCYFCSASIKYVPGGSNKYCKKCSECRNNYICRRCGRCRCRHKELLNVHIQMPWEEKEKVMLEAKRKDISMGQVVVDLINENL